MMYMGRARRALEGDIHEKRDISRLASTTFLSLYVSFERFLWYRLVRSYKDMNSGKFKVVHEIEAMLPVKPYDAEWTALGKGERPDLYLPFTHIETKVPWVFAAIHAVVLLQLLPWWDWLCETAAFLRFSAATSGLALEGLILPFALLLLPQPAK